MKNKNISPGTFAAVFGSINTMFMLSNEFSNNFINRLTNKSAMVFMFFKLMDLPTCKQEINYSSDDCLELRNVCYACPDASSETIKNISLKLKHGQLLSVVGENGAGKSTLAKVILGLYKFTKGTLIFPEPDGNNMSITSVFQDFNKYKVTLKENIGLSDVQRLAELTDEEVFEQCKEIDLSGIADIENAEQILSNDFGGKELSLGNWQRISLLRSLYRKCDTVTSG